MNEDAFTKYRGAAALVPGHDALEPFLLVDLPPSAEPMSATEDKEIGRISMAALHNPPADAPPAYVRELLECGVVDGEWLYIEVSDWSRLRAAHLRRSATQPQSSAAAATVAAIVAHEARKGAA